MNVDFNLILDNTKFDVVAHSLVGKNIKDALTSFFLQMVESFDWLTALIESFPEVPSQYWSITVFIFSYFKDLQCVSKKSTFQKLSRP